MLLLSITHVGIRQLLCKNCNSRQLRSISQLCRRSLGRPINVNVPPEVRCVVLLNAKVDLTCLRNFRLKVPGGQPDYKADEVDPSFDIIFSNRKVTMLKYLPGVYLSFLAFILPQLYMLLFEESKAKIGSMDEWIESYALYGSVIYVLGSIFVFFISRRYPIRIYHHPEKDQYVLIVKEYLSTGHVPFKASDIKPLALTASRWRGTTSIYGFPIYVTQADFVNLSYSNRFLFGIENTDDLPDTATEAASGDISVGAKDKVDDHEQVTEEPHKNSDGNVEEKQKQSQQK